MEKTLESPLDCKEIIHSILKELSPKYSLEGLVLKLKLQYLATLVKNWLTRKDPDAGKEWRQEEKGMAEDEMVGWHDWLDGHDFEQDLVVGDGQGNLVCCSPWGRKESNTTERLNWNFYLSNNCLPTISHLLVN